MRSSGGCARARSATQSQDALADRGGIQDLRPELQLVVDDVCDLELLSDDGERILCRGLMADREGADRSVLLAIPAADHPPPAALDRLAHEYALRYELDSAWAPRPPD